MGCFGSRVPSSLPSNEINIIQSKCNLNSDEINRWYSRFIHCYPNGYMNENEFIEYYQRLHNEFNLQFEEIIKQMFQGFDLNKDHKLDFYEFILFNVLNNDGTNNEKLEFIYRLFDNEKDFSKNELKEFLRNILYLFDIQISKFDLIHLIDSIFEQNHIPNDGKISWKLFTEYLMKRPVLAEDLIFSGSNVTHLCERF